MLTVQLNSTRKLGCCVSISHFDLGKDLCEKRYVCGSGTLYYLARLSVVVLSNPPTVHGPKTDTTPLSN